jgi:hypothetical protein
MSAKISNYVQDFRVPCGFMRDLRFLRMFRYFKADGVMAILLLWDWVAEQYPTTGVLKNVSPEVLHTICKIQEDKDNFVSTMIDSGVIDKDVNDTFYLPGWVEEQPYAAESEKRSTQARENANKRWNNNPATNRKKALCPGIALALQSECSNTNSKAFKSPPTPPRGREGKVPVNEIVQIYADILPELPKPNELTTKMRRDIEARWNAIPEQQSLEWWRRFFAKVRDCPHLMGETGDWRASLGWLVIRGNLDKVLSGQYLPLESKGRQSFRCMSEAEFEAMRKRQDTEMEPDKR